MPPTRNTLPASQRGWHSRVWRLAGPIILANMSVPLVGIVDTAVVGHLPDAVYIGAVALGAVIFNFVFWGFGFLRMGTTGFIAQAWGADDGNEIRAVLARSIALALLLGGTLIALQIPIAALSFTLLEGSVNLENHAQAYFDIRIWSAPATLVNYVILGCLIGLQNTRAVFIVQLFLNSTNVLLDLLFVMLWDMGVAGVAWATLVSEFAAAGLGLYLIRQQLNRVPGRFAGRDMFQTDKMLAMLKVNANIMIRTLCLIVAFFLFTAESTRLGEEVLAANAVLLHFLHLIAYGLDGFAHAAEALVGSAVGARNYRAFKQATLVSSLWALLVAIVYGVIYLLFGELIIALITDIESVRSTAQAFLPWLILAPLLSVWSYQLDGIFIGATCTTEMRNAMVVSLMMYIAMLWLLGNQYGNHGLWLSLLLFNVVRAISLVYYMPRLKMNTFQHAD